MIVALCLALFAATGTAAADTKVHRASQIQFWVPDTWTVEGEDKDQLTVSDPKGQVGLLFMVRDAKDIKAALASLDESIEQMATDVKIVGKPQKTTINGLETVIVDGTGNADGKKVELSVMVVKTPSGKYLAIFGVLEPAVKKKHEANLVKILASLKAAPKQGKFGK
ncbi:MAG: hypothetical protein ABI867_27535 [Kofleriaceae bacterium]